MTAAVAGCRSYSARTKLLVALFFLAHCPTTRTVRALFGITHSSMDDIRVKPACAALKHIIFVKPATKNVSWPHTKRLLLRCMQRFRDRFNSRGCIGALDGTFTRMKKPTQDEAGGDADAYWCYKQFLAVLTVVVVNADKEVMYCMSGVPGCAGDSGAFTKSRLKHMLDTQRVLERATAELRVGQQTHQIYPYMVGDSAFPLGTHLVKGYDIESAFDCNNDSAKRLNYRIVLARKEVEIVIGRMSGRWQFVKKNVHFGDPDFVTMCTQAAVGLHNFLEERTYEWDDEELAGNPDVEGGDVPMLQGW